MIASKPSLSLVALTVPSKLCRGQEQGADQFQDQCGENPYKKSCDNFAHTLNVVFLWPIENVFAVKFAKLNA